MCWKSCCAVVECRVFPARLCCVLTVCKGGLFTYELRYELRFPKEKNGKKARVLAYIFLCFSLARGRACGWQEKEEHENKKHTEHERLHFSGYHWTQEGGLTRVHDTLIMTTRALLDDDTETHEGAQYTCAPIEHTSRTRGAYRHVLYTWSILAMTVIIYAHTLTCRYVLYVIICR